MLNTFITERPLPDKAGKGQSLAAKAARKMGKVTVDDGDFIGRFENGAVANLEATRMALENHITIESMAAKVRCKASTSRT